MPGQALFSFVLFLQAGIVVEAYSPLAPVTAKPGGPLDPVLEEAAAAHKVTTGTCGGA